MSQPNENWIKCPACKSEFRTIGRVRSPGDDIEEWIRDAEAFLFAFSKGLVRGKVWRANAESLLSRSPAIKANS